MWDQAERLLQAFCTDPWQIIGWGPLFVLAEVFTSPTFGEALLRAPFSGELSCCVSTRQS